MSITLFALKCLMLYAYEYILTNDVIGWFGMWWMSSKMKVGVVM